MAKVQRITHVDDLTGADIPDGEPIETRSLTWKGKNYELDLTVDSATKVDAALEQIIKNATPVTGRGNGARTASSRQEAGKIREWARNQGLKVADRGRLNPAITAAYKAGHVSDEVRAAHGTEAVATPESAPEAAAPAPVRKPRGKRKAEAAPEPEFASA